MLLTEWASNLTAGTSSPSYHNQVTPASEDTYHERSLPRLRESDHSGFSHNPMPPHHADTPNHEDYRSSFRPGAARDFVGHGHIPVSAMHDHRVLLETPRDYDGDYDSGREEYGHIPVESSHCEVGYDSRFDDNCTDDRLEDSLHADSRIGFRSDGHAQQDFDPRSSERKHSFSMEADYDLGVRFDDRHRHASDVNFDDKHRHAAGVNFDDRHQHVSDVNFDDRHAGVDFDDRHQHASDMTFGSNSYNSSYPPHHHERNSFHDSSGPIDSPHSYLPGKTTHFDPDFRAGDRPLKYSQRKRSSSEHKKKNDFPQKRSRLEVQDHHPSSIGSQHSIGYGSSSLAPKQPLMNRLGSFSAEGSDSNFEIGEDSDLGVSERLGPSTIQSRLGPKQEPRPLLPDLRTKLNGRNGAVSDSPIPLFPTSPVAVLKPLHKTISKEKPLPNLSVPDFLKPGSSGNSPVLVVSGNLAAKTSGKSPGIVPPWVAVKNRTKDVHPPSNASLKDPLPASVKETLVSRFPGVDFQKKNTEKKVVKVIQKSSDVPDKSAPKVLENSVVLLSAVSTGAPSVDISHHTSPAVPSVQAEEPRQQHAVKSTTDPRLSKHPISDTRRHQPSPLLPKQDSEISETGLNHFDSDCKTMQHQTTQPQPLMPSELSDPRLKQLGGDPNSRQHQPSQLHSLQHAKVSDPRLKGLQQITEHQTLYHHQQQHPKVGDPRLNVHLQVADSRPLPHQQQPLPQQQQPLPQQQIQQPLPQQQKQQPLPQKQQPLPQQQQLLPQQQPLSQQQQLLPQQQKLSEVHLDEQRQFVIRSDIGQEQPSPPQCGQQSDPGLEHGQDGIDPVPQQLDTPTTATMNNVVQDSDSDKESDCGLVIDEDAYLCDSEGSEGFEEGVTESAPTVGVQPRDESEEGCPTIWDTGESEGELGEAAGGSLAEHPSVQSTIGVRTDRNTMRIACSMLSRILINQLGNEGNLLQKLYDAMKILVRFLNGRHSWHLTFVGHIRKMFHSYRIASAPSPTKLKDQFRFELKHLRNLCGSNVLLWQEQIQRFCLLALTFPKNKEDKRVEGFADTVVVKESNLVIVISSDDEESGTVGKGGKPLHSAVCVKSEPTTCTSEIGSNPQAGDSVMELSGVGNAKRGGLGGAVVNVGREARRRVDSNQPDTELNVVAVGPIELVHANSGQDLGIGQGPSSGQEGSIGQAVSSDKECSDGECSMSVCSTLSNSFDVDESGSRHAEDECGPDLRRWNHAEEQLRYQQEKCSVELRIGTDAQADRLLGGNDVEIMETEISKPPEGPRPPETPPNTPPRPPTPDSPFPRVASLSPGELTPSPPSSPKPTSRKKSPASQISTSASVPNKDQSARVGASHSSQHLPPKRKGVKPIRPRAHKPSAYRSPPSGISRSRIRFPRRSGSRSRDRYRHSKRSRSPNPGGRQRTSRSPLGHIHGRVGRRRSLSASPDRGNSKGKLKQQRKKLEEEDLELLQLKKEVILSIMQKPEADLPASIAAATPASKNIPTLQSTSLPSASASLPSASKKTSFSPVTSLLPLSKGTTSLLSTSKGTTSLPSTSKGATSLPFTSKSATSLPSTSKSLPSTSNGAAPLPSASKKTMVNSLLKGNTSLPSASSPSSSKNITSSASLPSSGKDTPLSSQRIPYLPSASKSSSSLLSSENRSTPSSSKDTLSSSKDTASSRISVAAKVSELCDSSNPEQRASNTPSPRSMTTTCIPAKPDMNSDGQVSLLAKKVMMGLAKKAVTKTLDRRNVSPSGGKSAHSSLNSSRVSSRISSPIGSPAHVPAALSTHSSEEAPGRRNSSGSVKPTASVKVGVLCNMILITWKGH